MFSAIFTEVQPIMTWGGSALMVSGRFTVRYYGFIYATYVALSCPRAVLMLQEMKNNLNSLATNCFPVLCSQSETALSKMSQISPRHINFL